MKFLVVVLLCFTALGSFGQVEVAFVHTLPTLNDATHIEMNHMASSHSSKSQAFEIHGSFTIVKARVNHKEGNFILDSGAPGLILNAEVPSNAQLRGHSLTGDVAVGIVRDCSFRWGAITQEKLRAYVMDLSYIEKSLGFSISGIIGYEQIKVRAVQIDYQKETVSWPSANEISSQAISLKIRWADHTPLLRSKVNGKRASLIFDTGAGANLLAESWIGHLDKANSKTLESITLRGLNNRKVIAQLRSVHLTEVENGNWLDLRFALSNLKEVAGNEQHIDGILGRPWVDGRVVTLDYRNNRIYIN